MRCRHWKVCPGYDETSNTCNCSLTDEERAYCGKFREFEENGENGNKNL